MRACFFCSGVLFRNLPAISAEALSHLRSRSLSQLAKLADSVWHSQFISVFMCECLFIYLAPNRPICRYHLPTQIVELAIPPSLPPCACPLNQVSTCFHFPRCLEWKLLHLALIKVLHASKLEAQVSKQQLLRENALREHVWRYCTQGPEIKIEIITKSVLVIQPPLAYFLPCFSLLLGYDSRCSAGLCCGS